jgi:hypothetical protein
MCVWVCVNVHLFWLHPRPDSHVALPLAASLLPFWIASWHVRDGVQAIEFPGMICGGAYWQTFQEQSWWYPFLLVFRILRRSSRVPASLAGTWLLEAT